MSKNLYRFSSLFWAGILFIAIGSSFVEIASANTLSNSIANPPTLIGASLMLKKDKPVPPEVAKAVRQDLAKRSGVDPDKIEIVKASQETWPDGCLGLAKADEICTQALVEGWRCVASDGKQDWVYRTNESGTNLRLERPQDK